MTSPIDRLANRSPKRHGLTLLELILSLGAATVLLAGLATAVRVTNRTLTIVGNTTRTDPVGPLALFKEDYVNATRVTALTSSQISCTVPDRNGDSLSETIHYRIVNGQLQRAENSTTYYPMGFSATGLAFANQSDSAASVSPYIDPVGRVSLQSYTSARLANPGTSLSLPAPAGVKAGDTLIYALAVEGNQTASLAVSGTWQAISNQNYGTNLTLRCGWRTATASEPSSYSATWSGSVAACGYVVRLSGASSSPIESTLVRSNWAVDPQSGATPEPYLTGVTSAANLTVVRFIAFDRDALYGGSSGLSRNVHLPVIDSEGSTPEVQLLGTVRQLTSTADESAYQFFEINTSTAFVALTIALRPAS